MIPLLDEAIDRLSDQLLESAPKNKPKVKAAKKNDRQEIYQLKISLKGSKPPIWRRILIPAEMELIDLHDAIQASMGWDGYHLHQFKQGNTFYLPEPDDEFTGFGGFDTEDSSGVRIDQLLRTEKDKIEYEYDFGDSWDHEVLLEKVLEPAAGAVYPVCVKGKGACPPEDCGGLWGYYNLLEILGDPEDEEHEGMLAWAGGPIDPAAFDLDEANARLREWFK
ncbi:MAG: plasmid pRiA4b ORF-3 family protein [Lentisphaerae bacterium]|nr:plasmid pRiA4b ORF-3 family protein [Lentisphaerota bacterium]